MEKTKKGLSFVAIVLAIVMLGGIVGFVVYAAISQIFYFGGNVSFVAEGVEATVEATDWEGCTIGGEEYSEDQTILQTIRYSTDKDADSTDEVKNSWSNLTIVVTDSTDGTATITFSVTNKFTDDTTISVTIGTITNESEDLTIEVDPDYVTISAGESQDFVITFTLDPSYTLDTATFSIPITIEVVEGYTVTFNDVSVSWASSTVTPAYSVSGEDESWIEFGGTEESIVLSNVYSIYFRGCLIRTSNFYYLSITDGKNSWITLDSSSNTSQIVEIEIDSDTELTVSTGYSGGSGGSND